MAHILVGELIKMLEEMPQGARVVIPSVASGKPHDIAAVVLLDDPMMGEFFENVLIR